MARYSNELINKLKSDISVARLVEQSGVTLKPHGKNLIGHCPFHNDKTPSLVVTPETNLWNCLGACQMGGSTIDWVMKSQGVSFRFACEILLTDVGRVTEAKNLSQPNRSLSITSPLTDQQDNQQLLNRVMAYYHETLKQSPEALAYLEKRGLQQAELIERFQLGYANRTLGYRLPNKTRKAGVDIRTQCQAIGIYRASGHEHFHGSLVVPILDEQGNVVEMYGRRINRLKTEMAVHLYLPGPHAGVWNLDAFKTSKEMILCEALIDAMTFWVHGFRNVTASYGTSGFTPAHLAALKDHGIERVWIAYDRDAAGNTAAEQLAKELIALGIECYRVLFPKNMDVNEYALKMHPAAKALGLALRQAEWLGGGKRSVNAEAEEVVKDVDDVKDIEEVESMDELPSLVASESYLPALPITTEEPTTSTDSPAIITENEVCLTFGDRHYRVRGLANNTGYDELKINLMAKKAETFHLDKLDLYSNKQRATFSHQASLELGVKDEVIKSDLGKLLLQLEALQEQQRQATRTPAEERPTMSEAERQAALDFLHDSQLLQRILDDFDRAGVVGEETNKLVGYLASVSRQLDKPLAVIIQSSSAAGKSSLMDAILTLMPEEERVQYSAMTGQSLFYMGETNLKHKILAIAEEEGASQASYALKLLQSEGEITIASTGKDAATGNLITHEYRVEGPVMLFLTTTAIDIDEELMNRCLVLTVNESREQTEAIHTRQRARRTLAGLQRRLERDGVIQLHRNAQRLLRPLAVINPYADQLTFLADKTRTRRDHEKYLALIDSIALLHQYQREIKTLQHGQQTVEYVEVTLDDIAVANRLANEVLGKTLDELPPQTRQLLILMQQQIRAHCTAQQLTPSHYRFSRKDVRAWCGWSYTQVRVHLERLVAMEYVLTHRGGRGQSFDYELLYDGEGSQGDAFLLGLMDVATLKPPTIQSSRGEDARLTGPKRPLHGAFAAPLKPRQPSNGAACPESLPPTGKSTLQTPTKNALSYTPNESYSTPAALAAKAVGEV